MLLYILPPFVLSKETKNDVEIAHTPDDKVDFVKPEHRNKFSGKIDKKILVLKGDTKISIIDSIQLYTKKQATTDKKKDESKKDESKDKTTSDVETTTLEVKDVVVEPKYIITGKETSEQLLEICDENKIIIEKKALSGKKEEEKKKILIDKLNFSDISIDLQKCDITEKTDNIIEFILTDDKNKQYLAQTWNITVDGNGEFKYHQNRPVYTKPWFWIVIVLGVVLLSILIALCCK